MTEHLPNYLPELLHLSRIIPPVFYGFPFASILPDILRGLYCGIVPNGSNALIQWLGGNMTEHLPNYLPELYHLSRIIPPVFYVFLSHQFYPTFYADSTVELFPTDPMLSYNGWVGT
jgi:hypothetical protein